MHKNCSGVQAVTAVSASAGKPNFSGKLSLLLGIVLCAQLAACSKSGNVDVPTAPAAPAAQAAPAAASSTASAGNDANAGDVSAKLQEYIDCYNKIDGGGHRTIARYVSWVKDMTAGPSGTEKVVYGLYSMDTAGIAKCSAVMKEAANKKPSLPKLDAAALSYADAISALSKAVDDVYPYYDRQNYKDDKFAKGKELHVPLAASAKAFQAASETFSTELDVENDKVLDAELVKLEKAEGRKLPYLRMAMMNKAKKLMAVIDADEFSADSATAKLADYEKITDEAMDFAKKNTGSAPSTWFTLSDAAEEFRKASKERVRRIRDKIPYNDGEKMMLKPGSAWMVEGSQEKAVKAYNKLVGASNSLQ